MSEYLAAAAEALGAPEALVRRSAEARAGADGTSVDEVLAAWAGEAAGDAAPPPEPVDQTPALEPEVPEPEPEPQPEPEPEPQPEPEAEPIMPAPAETFAPGPEADWEVVTAVPTAGLKERMGTRIPSWLMATFVILPLAGLLYLVQFSGGPDCGDGGLLAVDRLSGEVVNCDGSPFEGRGTPGAGPGDFLALGQTLYADTQVACNGCHGENGGGGVGPALTGGAVLATFPTCEEQVKWVQLGSAGWQAEVGPEYGAQGTLSQGGMPDYRDSLTDEELRAVVLFERVRFGGENLDEALVDCGLVIPELPAEDEEAPAEGDEPAEDTEASSQ
jgi:mono/diheme cytochrome c family protein